MIIGVPKEIKNNENRVAIIPEKASILSKQNHDILIESNAGLSITAFIKFEKFSTSPTLISFTFLR